MSKTLSVVLATFNEEKNLRATLESIKDIADEIVIVDGESLDKTVEIAKKFGAIVKVTTNKPNFHINKQMAVDMATKDWILQLDADEHISPELKDEIRKILGNRQSEDINGYWMPRKNWFLGRFLLKGGQYPDYTLRFYRNGKGRLPQKDVHEQAEVEGKVGYLKSALLHYPYKNFSHYLKKWNLYNNLFAKQIREEQKNKNILEKLFYAFAYLVLKPGHWFLITYFRHKGFMDLWSGFIFSLFSALRFPVSYLKYLGAYKVSFFLILLLSFVLRFYNFPNRWGLGGDDGRDAMIALEALKRFELPLMGPFSSAGPFVFGGIYYWFIMLSFLVLPFLVSAPWVLTGIIGVLTVGFITYLGRLMGGNKLSIIIGILAAMSPQLVVRSLMLGPHSFIPIFTTLLIISFVLLCTKKKLIYAFLMGVFLGLAISMHYQAVNLFIFLPAIFLVTSLSIKNRVLGFLLMIIGFLIPSFPILLWDFRQNFANINNILDYLLIAQYRIYVPNSWKIFIFDFIPWYWSFVVGRFYLLSFALVVLSSLVFTLLSIKKKLKPELIVFGGIFFILMFVNRFYKGERSEGYLLYLAPFILVFTAILINYLIFNKQKVVKYFGIVLFILILVGSLITVKNSYLQSPAKTYFNISKSLINKYPDSRFSLYVYKYKFYDSGMGLSLALGSLGKISKDGMPIGVYCYGKKECPENIDIALSGGVLLVDLRSEKNNELVKNKKNWVNVNQSSVYDNLIGWLNKNQLKSTFSLKNYIMEKVGKNI